MGYWHYVLEEIVDDSVERTNGPDGERRIISNDKTVRFHITAKTIRRRSSMGESIVRADAAYSGKQALYVEWNCRPQAGVTITRRAIDEPISANFVQLAAIINRRPEITDA